MSEKGSAETPNSQTLVIKPDHSINSKQQHQPRGSVIPRTSIAPAAATPSRQQQQQHHRQSHGVLRPAPLDAASAELDVLGSTGTSTRRHNNHGGGANNDYHEHHRNHDHGGMGSCCCPYREWSPSPARSDSVSGATTLSTRELAVCEELYDLFRMRTNSFTSFLQLIMSINQGLSENDVRETLREIGYEEGHFFTLDHVVDFMRDAKARQSKLSNEDAETLEAFVQLGGDPDSCGFVDANVLRETILSFNLLVDVDAMIAEVDSDGSGQIEFEEFEYFYKELKTQSSSTSLLMMQGTITSSMMMLPAPSPLNTMQSTSCFSDAGTNDGPESPPAGAGSNNDLISNPSSPVLAQATITTSSLITAKGTEGSGHFTRVQKLEQQGSTLSTSGPQTPRTRMRSSTMAAPRGDMTGGGGGGGESSIMRSPQRTSELEKKHSRSTNLPPSRFKRVFPTPIFDALAAKLDQLMLRHRGKRRENYRHGEQLLGHGSDLVRMRKSGSSSIYQEESFARGSFRSSGGSMSLRGAAPLDRKHSEQQQHRSSIAVEQGKMGPAASPRDGHPAAAEKSKWPTTPRIKKKEQQLQPSPPPSGASAGKGKPIRSHHQEASQARDDSTAMSARTQPHLLREYISSERSRQGHEAEELEILHVAESNKERADQVDEQRFLLRRKLRALNNEIRALEEAQSQQLAAHQEYHRQRKQITPEGMRSVFVVAEMEEKERRREAARRRRNNTAAMANAVDKKKEKEKKGNDAAAAPAAGAAASPRTPAASHYSPREEYRVFSMQQLMRPVFQSVADPPVKVEFVPPPPSTYRGDGNICSNGDHRDHDDDDGDGDGDGDGDDRSSSNDAAQVASDRKTSLQNNNAFFADRTKYTLPFRSEYRPLHSAPPDAVTPARLASKLRGANSYEPAAAAEDKKKKKKEGNGSKQEEETDEEDDEMGTAQLDLWTQ